MGLKTGTVGDGGSTRAAEKRRQPLFRESSLGPARGRPKLEGGESAAKVPAKGSAKNQPLKEAATASIKG